MSPPATRWIGIYDSDLAVGGRIVRDRLWFFGSGRRKEYRAEVIGYAGGPGPDGRYFTADDEQGTTTDRESNMVGKFTGQLAPTIVSRGPTTTA